MKISISQKQKSRIQKKARGFAVNAVIYAILICIVFLILYPLIVRIAEMFKGFNDLMDQSVAFIPKEPELGRIKMALDGMKYRDSFFQSLIVCSIVAVIQTVICTVVGYGFARYKFPFKKFFFALVLFTMLIPTPLIMPTYFMKFRFWDIFGIITLIKGAPLNMIDTYWPFVILSTFGLGFKNGLYIYVTRQFFSNMPKELEETGRIDGAGFIRIFFFIMIPNALVIMTTVFLFSFSWQWTDQYLTDLFLPGNFALSNALMTLTRDMTLQTVIINGNVSAGIILVLLPILILYLVLQKFFIQGIERSGLVG